MANATVTAPRQSDRLPVPEQVVADLTDGDRFARLLPACYRDSAERWINRGKLYLLTCKQSAKLLSCTRKSLVMAFLQGAEQGLPVDGKLAYLVPYGTDATFMASYIGLCAVARRHGLVTDAYARLVRERDEFDLQMDDGQFKVHFRPHIGSDAGEVIGAFACLLFPGKRVVADFMGSEEIESVRKRSKAASSGPWVTDWGEMAKKTVIRRTIKTYVDDPEVLSLLDSDDREHGIIDVDGVEVQETKRVGARRAAPLRLPSEAAVDIGPGVAEEIREEKIVDPPPTEQPNPRYSQWSADFKGAKSEADVDALLLTTKPWESPEDEDFASALAKDARERLRGRAPSKQKTMV